MSIVDSVPLTVENIDRKFFSLRCGTCTLVKMIYTERNYNFTIEFFLSEWETMDNNKNIVVIDLLRYAAVALKCI